MNEFQYMSSYCEKKNKTKQEEGAPKSKHILRGKPSVR